MKYKPIFSISNQLLNTIAEIESLHARSMGYYILPEREVEMRYRATVEATHNSTSIEGNPLTMKQVEAVLRSKGVTRHHYAEMEVRNYKAALDHIEQRKSQKTPITADDIHTLHRLSMQGLLPDEKTGEYRSGDIYIVDQNEKVKYSGPKAGSVHRKMDELLAWLTSDANELHPCIAAAILHFQFVSIHPFADGNGRTARLATILYLGIRDYDFRGSIVLDSYYAVEKQEYYGALHLCQGNQYREGQDISSWITYFVAGFFSSTKVLLAELMILSTLEPVITRQRFGQAEADILRYAKRFGAITLSEAAEILPNVPRRTLQRKLRQLTDSGTLIIEEAGKRTKYLWRDS